MHQSHGDEHVLKTSFYIGICHKESWAAEEEVDSSFDINKSGRATSTCQRSKRGYCVGLVGSQFYEGCGAGLYLQEVEKNVLNGALYVHSFFFCTLAFASVHYTSYNFNLAPYPL